MFTTNRFQIASLAACAALLLSGGAFAATPSAGMQPYFEDAASSASALQRATVHAAAIAHQPVAGQFADTGAPAHASTALSRAQVRAATRDAIAHGFHVASGESA